ncbi:MAG: DUF134 domain-containing protein [Lentimicrobiaceae bacterium]|nr:DUF134 domain-containing protein [Lentimicrobiaceae bacterium]
MPRPKRNRRIYRPPVASGFAPFGISSGSNGSVSLLYEEYESLRLSDYEGIPQQEAADKMNISRPTYSRIYDQARQKLARALVEGLSVLIEGGNVSFDEVWFRCKACSTAFSPPENQPKVSGCPVCRSSHIVLLSKPVLSDNSDLLPRPAVHQTGYCLCPRCGLRVSHQAGIPCRSLVCTSCGSVMIRENHPISNSSND